MRFDLKGIFTFSGDISSIKNEIKEFISAANENLLKKDAEKEQILKVSRLKKTR